MNIPNRASDAGPDQTTPMDFIDYCFEAEDEIKAARRGNSRSINRIQHIEAAIEYLRKSLEVA